MLHKSRPRPGLPHTVGLAGTAPRAHAAGVQLGAHCMPGAVSQPSTPATSSETIRPFGAEN